MYGNQPTHQPEPGAPDRRGSHATTIGQGFSWVVAWTIVGSLVPGTGLIAAGWRRLGALVLLLLGLGLAGFAVMALTGDTLHRVLDLALDPAKLLYIMAGAIALGLIWAAVILLTHSQLRRYANLTNGQRAFSTIIVIALLVGVALPAYKVASYANIQRGLVGAITAGNDENDGTTTELGTTKDPWAGITRENVLLIGSDAGKGRIGTRPDTMIVASIDVKSGNTVLFSLPRNLERAPFPEGTGGHRAFPDGFYCAGDACMLNAVWTWAEGAGRQYYKDSPNPGLRATEDAIQGVTGLRINTWASLNLKGFQEFVDAIGGVRVNVYEKLPIAGNSEGGCGMGGYITPGKNKKLDGYHALWFARSRCSTSDFDRIRRQRCVIGAVVQQADPAQMVKKFPSIAKAAKGNIGTGIKQKDLSAWLTLALRVKEAKVTSLPFDDKLIPDRTDPDYPKLNRLVEKALKESVAPEPVATATTPATGATPSPGASSGTKTGTKTGSAADPTKAQSIKDVC